MADLVPEPFILSTPMEAPAREKGGFHQHIEVLPESHTSDASSHISESPSHARGSVGAMGPEVGNPDALHALERRLEMRLENMFHTLAIHGDTDSNPPEYDGQGQMGER